MSKIVTTVTLTDVRTVNEIEGHFSATFSGDTLLLTYVEGQKEGGVPKEGTIRCSGIMLEPELLDDLLAFISEHRAARSTSTGATEEREP